MPQILNPDERKRLSPEDRWRRLANKAKETALEPIRARNDFMTLALKNVAKKGAEMWAKSAVDQKFLRGALGAFEDVSKQAGEAAGDTASELAGAAGSAIAEKAQEEAWTRVCEKAGSYKSGLEAAAKEAAVAQDAVGEAWEQAWGASGDEYNKLRNQQRGEKKRRLFSPERTLGKLKETLAGIQTTADQLQGQQINYCDDVYKQALLVFGVEQRKEKAAKQIQKIRDFLDAAETMLNTLKPHQLKQEYLSELKRRFMAIPAENHFSNDRRVLANGSTSWSQWATGTMQNIRKSVTDHYSQCSREFCCGPLATGLPGEPDINLPDLFN